MSIHKSMQAVLSCGSAVHAAREVATSPTADAYTIPLLIAVVRLRYSRKWI